MGQRATRWSRALGEFARRSVRRGCRPPCQVGEISTPPRWRWSAAERTSRISATCFVSRWSNARCTEPRIAAAGDTRNGRHPVASRSSSRCHSRLALSQWRRARVHCPGCQCLPFLRFLKVKRPGHWRGLEEQDERIKESNQALWLC